MIDDTPIDTIISSIELELLQFQLVYQYFESKIQLQFPSSKIETDEFNMYVPLR